MAKGDGRKKRQPGTEYGKAYAHDLKDYFDYLASWDLQWARLRYDELAGFMPF